jgi:Flp pilus assembly protein TadB
MSDDNPTADNAFDDDNRTGNPIEENLKSRATWLRLAFMIVSAVLLSVTSIVGSVVVVFGFLWLLFTGEVNRQIQQVGQSIAAYVYDIVRYLTFNTDEKPFPMGGDWPSGDSS